MTIRAGAKVDATDLAALGTSWTAYTPTVTNATAPAVSGAYALVGKTLFLRGAFTGGTVTAAGIVSVSLPAGLTGVAAVQYLSAGLARKVVTCLLNNATNLLEISADYNATNWAAGATLNTLRWTGTVEIV